MPGTLDSSRPNSSYISSWAVYRSAIAANDDTAHPENVLSIIDLSKSFNGINNEIWICPVRTSGAGVITLTPFLLNGGSLATVQPYVTITPQAGADTLTYYKFSNLLAGKYVVLVTGISGNVWTLHYATLLRGISSGSSSGGGSGGSGAGQIFSGEDYPLVGGIPSVTPTTKAALWIGVDGQNIQWFNGAWNP